MAVSYARAIGPGLNAFDVPNMRPEFAFNRDPETARRRAAEQRFMQHTEAERRRLNNTPVRQKADTTFIPLHVAGKAEQAFNERAPWARSAFQSAGRAQDAPADKKDKAAGDQSPKPKVGAKSAPKKLRGRKRSADKTTQRDAPSKMIREDQPKPRVKPPKETGKAADTADFNRRWMQAQKQAARDTVRDVQQRSLEGKAISGPSPDKGR